MRDKPSALSDTRYAIRDLPFDRVAADYDRAFTDTRLARVLREIVWSRLAEHFRPGMRVLEIGCGTGEDAAWLAQRGVHVLATDVSPAMLEVTCAKAQRAGVTDRVETFVLDAASPDLTPSPSPFLAERERGRVDAAFSNFGALNCVRDLQPIADALAEWVQPGGQLVLVLINRWCAWELLWHLLHFQPRVAFRRLRREGVDARLGEGVVHTWYPSIASVQRTFAPAFDLRRAIGLGVFLPPSYLEPVVAQRPRLFQLLARLEHALSKIFPFSRIADHILLEFERASP